jgi:hypothetical protein
MEADKENPVVESSYTSSFQSSNLSIDTRSFPNNKISLLTLTTVFFRIQGVVKTRRAFGFFGGKKNEKSTTRKPLAEKCDILLNTLCTLFLSIAFEFCTFGSTGIYLYCSLISVTKLTLFLLSLPCYARSISFL